MVDSDDTDRSTANNSDFDGPGDRTRFIYDGFDRRTSAVDSVGNQTVFQYDPAGNVVRSLQFGPVGGVSPTSDGPDLLKIQVSVNGVVQIGNLVNANLLAAAEYLYDELGREIQTDDVLFVNTTSTQRAPDVDDGAIDLGKGNLTPGDNQHILGISGVAILGRVSSRHEYDRNSRQTFSVEDDSDGTRIFYDGAGRVIKLFDAAGNTIEYAYDDNSNLIETRETDVSQVGGVASEVFLTTSFFDSLNRLERQVDNIGQAVNYRYDSRSNLVAMADAQGPMQGEQIVRRAFANGALTVNDINSFGNVTVYTHDGFNRRILEEIVLTVSGYGDGLSIGASTEGIKNKVGSPDSFLPARDLTHGGGDGIIRIGTTYDNNSLVSSRIDDQGNVTLYLYDNLNRQVTETKGLTTLSPLSKVLILGSRQIVTPTAATINNPAFIATSKIDAQLADAAARLALVAALFPPLANQIDDSPPTTIVYGYDPDNNVLIKEDENDNEFFTKYDALNRAVAVRIYRSGQSDSYVVDPIIPLAPVSDPSNPSTGFPAVAGSNKQGFEYDGLSRLVFATDNNSPTQLTDDSEVRYSYDSLSRLIEESQRIGSAGSSLVVSTGWRANDLKIDLTYPNERVLNYTYDTLDRIDKIADSGAALPLVDYDYIGVGRVLVRTLPQNGTRQTYLNNAGTADVGYDGLRRVVQLRHLRSNNSLIVGFTHSYDRANNKLSEVKLHDAVNSEAYEYDSAYRLTMFDRPSLGAVAPLQKNFVLDGVGNWSQVDAETRDYSSFNEITSRNGVALFYDDNGNLTDDGSNSYQWDAFNRLRIVTRNSDGLVIAEYGYDATGRRASKSVQNSGVFNGYSAYYYDGSILIEVRNAAGTLAQQYVYGNYVDEALVQDTNLNGDGNATGAGDRRLFYHQNTQFSTYALTTVAATIVETYMYEAFGKQTVVVGAAITPGGSSTVGNLFLFTGRQLDSETGLIYFRTRYMDALQGRFISRDTIGTWTDNQSLGNAYTYVGNNPISGLDPDGTKGRLKKAVQGVVKAVTNVVKTVVKNTVTSVKSIAKITVFAAKSIVKAVAFVAKRIFATVKAINQAIPRLLKVMWANTIRGVNPFKIAKSKPFYGLYCGKVADGFIQTTLSNGTFSPPPINALDACCAQHDTCAQAWSVFVSYSEEEQNCNSCICACSRTVVCSSITSSAKEWRECRAAQRSIQIVFCRLGY